MTQFGQDVWRSRWPNCTMSMSWVFNAVDPNTMCWSYIDYFGIPKRSHFFRKKSFESLQAGTIFDDCFTPPGETFRGLLFVHNQTDVSYENAKLNVRLYDINLNIIKQETIDCNISKDGVSDRGMRNS